MPRVRSINLITGTVVCPACNTNLAGNVGAKETLLSKARDLLKKLGYERLNADVIERLHGQRRERKVARRYRARTHFARETKGDRRKTRRTQ